MTTHRNVELENRLLFLGLDAASSEAIRGLGPVIDRELPVALQGFYAKVRVTPEMKAFFSNEQHMQRAQTAQINHWSSIREGRFDEKYAANVRTIGLTHARIGLKPSWYIGGYALIVDHLLKAIVAEEVSKFRSWGRKPDVEQLATGIGALMKAVLLDMDFAISVYLEAAEEARLKGEAEAKSQEQALVCSTIGAAATKLADKDLTHRIRGEMPEAYLGLQKDFNAAFDQLGSALAAVSASTGVIRSSASEVASAADDLSKRTEQQAAGLEQTAAALDEITSTVQRTAAGANHAQGIVANAMKEAEESSVIVDAAVRAVSGIERSSQQINQIIGVMDEIAFQTNLLALNAGVEAARAGDAGRGFAVVASEVRALAQRSAEAAKEIKSLISASATEVAHGVSLVAKTGEALAGIVTKVREINGIVSDIASGAQEQATALHQVNVAINQLDQTTQQNAAMVEQSTAASHSLTNEAGELAGLVGQFILGGTTVRTQPPSKSRQSLNSKARNGRLALAPEPEASTWEDF